MTDIGVPTASVIKVKRWAFADADLRCYLYIEFAFTRSCFPCVTILFICNVLHRHMSDVMAVWVHPSSVEWRSLPPGSTRVTAVEVHRLVFFGIVV